nr:hypothetical protein MACL_00002012 [Theileria orientalis]
MNIFRAVNTVLYPLFIFLLFSGRNLLESTDTSAGSTPGSGAGTNESQPASATPPSGGTTLNPDQDATSTTPPASTNEGQQASGTPASGGTTTGAGAGSGTKTGVELSLKATASTDQFDHNKNNKIVTYTAKDTYGFKSVKTGDTVVWSTTNASEYASKVVLNGKGNKKKEVTIHLPNGTKKVFKRENKGKPWIELSQDNKEGTSTTGGDGSEFELNIKSSDDKSDPDKYDVTTSFSKSKIYSIKSGKKCTLIKVEDKEVWKYDSSKNFGYPKKINYNEEQNKIIITLDDGYLEYNKKIPKRNQVQIPHLALAREQEVALELAQELELAREQMGVVLLQAEVAQEHLAVVVEAHIQAEAALILEVAMEVVHRHPLMKVVEHIQVDLVEAVVLIEQVVEGIKLMNLEGVEPLQLIRLTVNQMVP